jgi:tRNA uridine 5-carbamoylmethylation protein Kti12
MQPDPPLSAAARDVAAELEAVDRQYRKEQDQLARRGVKRREPTGPELARLLLARYVVPKKRWWKR